MVLPGRIELTTSPLPRGCSTTELRQRLVNLLGRPLGGAPDIHEAPAIDKASAPFQVARREDAVVVGCRLGGGNG